MAYSNNQTNFSPLPVIVTAGTGAALGILVNFVAFVFILFGNKVKSAKQKFLLAILTLNNAAALRITTSTIQRLLCTILLLASLFTLAPLMGLGAYYSTEKQKCVTYSNPTNDLDYAYGIAFVCFGFSICLTLVICNIGVVTKLHKYNLSTPHKKCMKSDDKQEVVFSKLIVAISMLYIICWLPHMIASALNLSLEDIASKSFWYFDKIANLLMLLNFIINPFIQMFMLK
ncbi:unnamed protein product [Pieris brassicae]|uniref:G-protein coupled receptors family 1 profile domain-containing protein n=1 Tax=Pieris brassicae TaxID=7116 RepID=A0A9P0TVA6_PIEBR|nr:unnamed protein product [Pieris brassicae]